MRIVTIVQEQAGSHSQSCCKTANKTGGVEEGSVTISESPTSFQKGESLGPASTQVNTISIKAEPSLEPPISVKKTAPLAKQARLKVLHSQQVVRNHVLGTI